MTTIVDFYHGYSGGASTAAHAREFLDDITAGRDVYVQFKDMGKGRPHSRRTGAIAKITRLHRYKPWSSYNGLQFDIEASWDGRKNKTIVSQYDVVWLKDYTGPTEWVFATIVDDRPKVKKVKDRLGNVLKEGDFCTYVLNKFAEGSFIFFGTITKITPQGDVYCRNQAVAKDEEVIERKVKDPSTMLVVLTRNLVDTLVLMKLSGDKV